MGSGALASHGPGTVAALEPDLVAAFERKDLARVIRRGDFEPEAFENLAHLFHLLRIGFGKLARPGPQRVLHADTDIAAHRGGLRRDAHLVRARPEYRPMIVVAEQAIGGALHHDDVLGMRADAA